MERLSPLLPITVARLRPGGGAGGGEGGAGVCVTGSVRRRTVASTHVSFPPQLGAIPHGTRGVAAVGRVTLGIQVHSNADQRDTIAILIMQL